jgi:hypothetical protein
MSTEFWTKEAGGDSCIRHFFISTVALIDVAGRERGVIFGSSGKAKRSVG